MELQMFTSNQRCLSIIYILLYFVLIFSVMPPLITFNLFVNIQKFSFSV